MGKFCWDQDSDSKFVVWIKIVFLLITLLGTADAEKAPDYVSELEKSFSHGLWAALMYHLGSVCKVKSASRPLPRNAFTTLLWEKYDSEE